MEEDKKNDDLLSISLNTSYNESSVDEELGLSDKLNNLANEVHTQSKLNKMTYGDFQNLKLAEVA